MEKKIKILHCPVDINGQFYNLSKELNKNSIFEVETLSIYDSEEYNYTYNLNLRHSNQLIKLIVNALFFFRNIWKYDIVHYHCHTLLPFLADIIILKLLKKKIIFHFRGSDARPNKYLLDTYENNTLKERILTLYNRYRVAVTSKICDQIYVATPDLKCLFRRKVIYIPYIMDTNKYIAKKARPYHRTVNIIHAPTNRRIKGSDIVIDTIIKIKKRGYEFNFQLIENLEHSKIQAIINKSDIVIDQLLVGWYGYFAAEAVLSGKTVLSYVRPDLKHKHHQECLITPTSSETIYSDIIECLKDHESPAVRQNKIAKAVNIFSARKKARIIGENYLSLFNH